MDLVKEYKETLLDIDKKHDANLLSSQPIVYYPIYEEKTKNIIINNSE